MKIKTAEATGPALDWLVAIAEGYSEWDGEAFFRHRGAYCACFLAEWHPSTDWAQGGPIIEREKIDLAYHGGNGWRAAQVYRHDPATSYGPTVLIAAMRCYVASKLGDEVEITEELVCVASH